MALESYLAGEIAQDCADGLLSRRDAIRRLVLLGLSVPAAGILLAACGGDSKPPVAASGSSTTVASSSGAPVGDAPTSAEVVRFAGPSGELTAAFAASPTPKAALLVIHENRGLTPHFHDVVARFAAEGYTAICVDLVSAEGGTAALDEGAVQSALGGAPVARLLGDLRAGIDELEQRAPGRKLGTVGFCFGGGMVWNLLQDGESRLAAAVPFYGPAPDAPDFSRAKAAVLGIYGELDARVNASRDSADAALTAAGLTHEMKTFAGADHAFFNDTGARYNATAAAEANTLVLAWFDRYLT
ncbi:MAG: carboxymethylenebutenolidase [Acidimicrobiaceae bacterium]|jgi:carboxymethylenebutenolidase